MKAKQLFFVIVPLAIFWHLLSQGNNNGGSETVEAKLADIKAWLSRLGANAADLDKATQKIGSMLPSEIDIIWQRAKTEMQGGIISASLGAQFQAIANKYQIFT